MCLLITLLGIEGLHIKQFLISAFKGYTVLFSFCCCCLIICLRLVTKTTIGSYEATDYNVPWQSNTLVVSTVIQPQEGNMFAKQNQKLENSHGYLGKSLFFLFVLTSYEQGTLKQSICNTTEIIKCTLEKEKRNVTIVLFPLQRPSLHRTT